MNRYKVGRKTGGGGGVREGGRKKEQGRLNYLCVPHLPEYMTKSFLSNLSRQK
jgi:hypothetical protein